MRSSAIPAGEHVPTADQRVVIYGVPWSHFEAQLKLKGDASAPRVAYCRGALELMMPSKGHERTKSYIGCLVMACALESGIDLSPYGGWTLKNRPSEAGAEPGECYLIGPDQDRDVPDLVIEVVWTTGGLNKLEIYRRLGIPECWQWQNGRIETFLLRGDHYEKSVRSSFLPGLDIELLTSFLDLPTATQAVRKFREALAATPRKPRTRSR